MLKVCVDATAIRGQLSGIGFYNLSLLRALNELQHSQQFQGQFSLQIYYQPGLKDWCQGNWQKKTSSGRIHRLYLFAVASYPERSPS